MNLGIKYKELKLFTAVLSHLRHQLAQDEISRVCDT
jgi:hypothetical protein